MTERGLPIVGGAPACPFVAFEDDRDERATSPDHRHRCYADSPPAPRALAHQEAYCLSSAFPVCPTFQDWARREAARTRPPDLAPPDAEEDEFVPPLVDDRPPRRSSRGTWSAPPPWLSGAGSGAAAQAGSQRSPAAEDAGIVGPDAAAAAAAAAGAAAAGAAAGGLAGSFADRVASDHPGSTDWNAPAPGPSPASPAGAQPEAGPAHPVQGYGPEAGEGGEAQPPAPPRHRERLEAGSDRLEDPREQDVAAPSWERPRRLETYPTLRSRRLSATLPPILLGVVALILAGAALVFLPSLFGFGVPASSVSPSSGAGASVAPSGASFAPTAVPAPTQSTYTVVAGDTLTSIAKKKGISLNDLIAANPSLKDPNRLDIGQVLVIPVPQPSTVPAAS